MWMTDTASIFAVSPCLYHSIINITQPFTQKSTNIYIEKRQIRWR